MILTFIATAMPGDTYDRKLYLFFFLNSLHMMFKKVLVNSLFIEMS